MSLVFDAYAAYYDLFYKDKDYAGEAEYIDSLIRKYVPEGKHILELGCGTGAHAEHFARLGYMMTGVDMSSAMLDRAEKRKAGMPDELAQRLSFSKGNVCDFRNDSTFDVVISLFHVFSYQTTNRDLQSVFETAATHIRPGGILIFDYWYGPAVLSQRPEVRVKRLEDDQVRVTRIAEPVLLPAGNKVEVHYDVSIMNKKSSEHSTVKEKHIMRYLFQPEIEKYAEEEFSVIEHYAWLKHSQATIEDWSAVSLLVKK